MTEYVLTEYVTIEKEVYENLLKTVHEIIVELQKRVEELEKHLCIYENPNVSSSKKMMKEDKEKHKPEGKSGAPEGHIGATRKRLKPNRFVDLKPELCAKCESKGIAITEKERRGYAQMSYGPYTNRIIVQWARVRNTPPNGVMPIATDPNLSIR